MIEFSYERDDMCCFTYIRAKVLKCFLHFVFLLESHNSKKDKETGDTKLRLFLDIAP